MTESACSSEKKIELEADGVQLPACVDFEVSIIPASLTFVTPK